MGAGRDGCRAPMPWLSAAPHEGFSEVTPWLPAGPDWPALAVDQQENDPMSTLVLTKGALALRKRVPALGLGSREQSAGGSLRWLDAPPDVLVFERPGSPAVVCAANFGSAPVELDLPGRLLLASAPLAYDGRTLSLPPDATAWLVPEV
jgi:alpha-glucosidase